MLGSIVTLLIPVWILLGLLVLLGSFPEPLVVQREPQLKEAFTLERRQLLPRLPFVHRELVLDHLLGERLVPCTAANPVLACAHDVDAATLAGARGGRCGRTAGELLGKAPDLEPQLVGRPLLQRLRHRVEGTRRTG